MLYSCFFAFSWELLMNRFLLLFSYSLVVFCLLAGMGACSTEDSASETDPDSGNTDADTDTDTDTDTDADTDTDTDTDSDTDADTDTDSDTDTDTDVDSDTGWPENPGCDAEQNIVVEQLRIELEIDLSDYSNGKYSMKQRLIVTPLEDGDAVSFFGHRFEMGHANTGYSYDDHVATFCTEPFAAGADVAIESQFTVDENKQSSLPFINWGLKRHKSSNGLVIGPFNEPYYASDWMLVPQSLHMTDAEYDDNPAVVDMTLSIVTPDDSWTVVGQGGPAKPDDSNTWTFNLDKPQPIYAVSFAASPNYETFEITQSKSGVKVVGAVLPGKRDDAEIAFAPAAVTIDWMEENIGPYEWGEYLTFAEIPKHSGGMEHTTVVWIGSDIITTDFVGMYVTVHETMHHWWGDNVRFADWPHFWLAEGFDEWTTNFKVLKELMGEQELKGRLIDYRKEAAETTMQQIPGQGDPGPLRFDDDDDMGAHFLGDLQLFYKYGGTFLEMVNQRLIRDFDTDLVLVLADWFDLKHMQAATTEDFLAFLEESTDSGPHGYWGPVFDDWVYKTPCPSIEIGDYDHTGNTVSLTVNRLAEGGDQDMPAIDIIFVVGGEGFATTVDLAPGTASATASASVPAEPERIVVDPNLFYVMRLEPESGWVGPTVSFAFE
jgi:peptidase M1-like protein